MLLSYVSTNLRFIDPGVMNICIILFSDVKEYVLGSFYLEVALVVRFLQNLIRMIIIRGFLLGQSE